MSLLFKEFLARFKQPTLYKSLIKHKFDNPWFANNNSSKKIFEHPQRNNVHTNKMQIQQTKQKENKKKIVASYVVEHLPKIDPHISKMQRKQTKHKQRWTKARPKKQNLNEIA